MSMKNSNDTIENRTSDLPACSAVPQPIGSPRAGGNVIFMDIKIIKQAESQVLVQDVDWLLGRIYHAEFGKYIVWCSVKAINIISSENVNKFDNEQFLILNFFCLFHDTTYSLWRLTRYFILS